MKQSSNSDYVSIYDEEQTIILKEKINNIIKNIFKNKFKLIEIDPKVISQNIINNNERVINFDNSYQDKIFYLNNNISLYLYEKINSISLNNYNGFICYNSIINRDYYESNIITNYEFKYNIIFQTKIININLNYLCDIVINLFKEINEHINLKDNVKSINKIKIIDSDQIFKMYPFIKKENLLNEIVFRYKSVLIIHPNGFNTRNINFIEDNIIYGELVATLFVYDDINNSVLKILTINNIANKKFLQDKIIDNLNIKNNLLTELINNAKEFNNQIAIEFYLSRYLLFCLSKFSINEIID